MPIEAANEKSPIALGILKSSDNDRLREVNVLKRGSKEKTSPNAQSMDMKAINMDSDKNCDTKPFRVEPNTLRTPISLARLMERAVVRLMKLTTAISKMNNPIPVKIYTYSILPFGVSSPALGE
ncbi:hypothetical protein SAMN05660293_02783 [Dyadobacter psychrophilus]|uniref:Uncharacterized protein n=1 Tax=Dyadobacter psychrophilus TaxID=651661 RepID=A0A1T5EV74_9BACT|nr:hypothetical protein [Dyadobacter psychrophilus]SKB87620.1 hypothetical protein SAMN05660293_02783 [Dyadobacter psychrophilus]